MSLHHIYAFAGFVIVEEREKRNFVANLDLIQAHFSDTSNLQISLSGIESHPLNCILKCNHAATGGLLWLPHHWCYDAKYGWGEKY